LSPEERDTVANNLLALAGEDPADAGLGRDAIRRLVTAGFTIGFHTRRHDTLTRLDDDALEHAMQDGRSDLEQLAGHAIDTIAYPHGRADGRVARAAQRAGFQIGFTALPTATTPATDPLLIGRFEAMDIEPSVTDSHAAFALSLMRALLRNPHRNRG
jgi:peptidoglycan/xylan/chitin deacetylase (PgdA/CDA1 family)